MVRESEIGGSANGRSDALPSTIVDTVAVNGWKETAESLLVVLSKSRNPLTGKTYTYAELGEVFHYNPTVIQRKLTRRGVYRQPFPEVCHDELPENEKAFFMGLALGDCSIEHIRWGKREGFVMVGTESAEGWKRQTLKQTIGTWGETRESFPEVRIYVNSPKFDFMLNPLVDAKFLAAKRRFAPFLLGILVARLSNQRHRLSLNNEALLRRIDRQFSTHFGFRMGNFRVEQRNVKSSNGSVIGERSKVPVIVVRDPGQVFGALLQVRSVTSLPFLGGLGKISPNHSVKPISF